MCACVCVPLYVHVKMRRQSDKYLANISKTVTTSRAVLTYKTEIDVHSDVKQAAKWQVYWRSFLIFLLVFQ